LLRSDGLNIRKTSICFVDTCGLPYSAWSDVGADSGADAVGGRPLPPPLLCLVWCRGGQCHHPERNRSPGSLMVVLPRGRRRLTRSAERADLPRRAGGDAAPPRGRRQRHRVLEARLLGGRGHVDERAVAERVGTGVVVDQVGVAADSAQIGRPTTASTRTVPQPTTRFAGPILPARRQRRRQRTGPGQGRATPRGRPPGRSLCARVPTKGAGCPGPHGVRPRPRPPADRQPDQRQGQDGGGHESGPGRPGAAVPVHAAGAHQGEVAAAHPPHGPGQPPRTGGQRQAGGGDGGEAGSCGA
jgi:hypothetical protein